MAENVQAGYSPEFNMAMEFIFKWEGGYVNDPKDPGGETKYGISKRAYPGLNIKTLSIEDAKRIYKEDYWMASGADKLEWPMCIVVMDTAVNMGVGRAKGFKSKAGNWTDYLFLRLKRYSEVNKPHYLRGWLNRVIDLYETIGKEGANSNS